MMNCETVLSELWDWHASQDSHPDHPRIAQHLKACPACRAQADQVSELRGCLKQLPRDPGPAFETGLRERLACLAAGLPDPLAGRFAVDPFLEDAAPAGSATGEGKTALLVDRRRRAAWLVKPLGLVAAGAAAAILLGLVARWTADPHQPATGSTLAGAPLAPATQPIVAPAGQPVAASADPTGVLADRAWQEKDSSQTQLEHPDRRERLTPVTTTP